MKSQKLFFNRDLFRSKPLIFSMGLLCIGATFSGCHPQNNSPTSKSALSPELHQALDLKPGMQITLEMAQVTPETWLKPNTQQRYLRINNLGGSEGINFIWQDGQAPSPLKINDSDEPAEPAENTSMGSLGLPNFFQARMMTLPVFWSPGSLYLSQSSGIWLSDLAYQELGKNGSSTWESGLIQNPILGQVQEIPPLEKLIQSLGPLLMAQQKPQLASLQGLERISYPLILNGKNTEVPVLKTDTWLGRYWILDHPTNPLILKFELAPHANVTDWLWMPLPWIKKVVEYKVVEIKS